MEGQEAEAGCRPCYHGANSEATHTLAAVQGVVGEVVPVNAVTWEFAILVCSGGLFVGFVVGLFLNLGQRRGWFERKRPDYDDL